ncbi:MAG: hypothetical protein V3V78_02695 [Candidatus Woesearchaeota archaeon]
MVKNYVFAGIDFIIDQQGELYFIEANSSPGVLKRYKAIYKHCRPIKELCTFLNKKYKNLAIISKKKWKGSVVSKEFRKGFKGNIHICDYNQNRKLMSKGDGHLIDIKGKKIMPDVVLRVAAGRTYAQEKAGIRIINPTCILNITKDKIKAKKIVEKYTRIKTPKSFRIYKKTDIKKRLNKNKKLFSNGFILKPQHEQKSEGVFIFYSYKEIPKNFKIKKPYFVEELILPSNLFKGEFFEIRSMTVNGKYAGSMLFVSPKRPMHLVAEGRVEKIPKKLEDKIKKATEAVVKAIDKHSLKEKNIK